MIWMSIFRPTTPIWISSDISRRASEIAGMRQANTKPAAELAAGKAHDPSNPARKRSAKRSGQNTLSIFNADHKMAKKIGKKWRRGRDSNPRKEFLPLTI